MPIEVQCAECGKMVKRKPSKVKRAANPFCSKPCFNAWLSRRHSDLPDVACENCGTLFKRRPSESDRRFCSKECRLQWSRLALKCSFCGNDFTRHRGNMGKWERQYCGRACFQASVKANQSGPLALRWQGGKVTFDCAQCGKEGRRRRAELSYYSLHFCSRECHGKYRSANWTGRQGLTWSRVTSKCQQCGSEVERKRSRLRRNRMQFCGRACLAEWRSIHRSGQNSYAWKGGDWGYYYGPNWRRQRRAARKRDGYKCQHCGVTEEQLGQRLDVHHIKPFREFGYIPDENENYKEANRLSNLISLCRTCHMQAEHGKIALL